MSQQQQQRDQKKEDVRESLLKGDADGESNVVEKKAMTKEELEIYNSEEPYLHEQGDKVWKQIEAEAAEMLDSYGFKLHGEDDQLKFYKTHSHIRNHRQRFIDSYRKVHNSSLSDKDLYHYFLESIMPTAQQQQLKKGKLNEYHYPWASLQMGDYTRVLQVRHIDQGDGTAFYFVLYLLKETKAWYMQKFHISENEEILNTYEPQQVTGMNAGETQEIRECPRFCDPGDKIKDNKFFLLISFDQQSFWIYDIEKNSIFECEINGATLGKKLNQSLSQRFRRNICYRNDKVYLLLGDLRKEKRDRPTRRLVEISVNLETKDYEAKFYTNALLGTENVEDSYQDVNDMFCIEHDPDKLPVFMIELNRRLFLIKIEPSETDQSLDGKFHPLVLNEQPFDQGFLTKRTNKVREYGQNFHRHYDTVFTIADGSCILVKVDIEKNETILMDKIEHVAFQDSWVVRPEQGDQKAHLKKVPHCFEQNVGGICNNLLFYSFVGARDRQVDGLNKCIMISTIRTKETPEEEEDFELKSAGVMKKLKLHNKHAVFQDAVDSFISVVNTEKNISRLYIVDHLGYTQVKYFKFEREQGEIITTKIDDNGNLWTLLKAPLKTDIQDSQVSTHYFLVKNGDIHQKIDFELPIEEGETLENSDSPKKFFVNSSSGMNNYVIIITNKANIYELVTTGNQTKFNCIIRNPKFFAPVKIVEMSSNKQYIMARTFQKSFQKSKRPDYETTYIFCLNTNQMVEIVSAELLVKNEAISYDDLDQHDQKYCQPIFASGRKETYKDKFEHAKRLVISLGETTETSQEFLFNTDQAFFRYKKDHTESVLSIKKWLTETFLDKNVPVIHSHAYIYQTISVKDGMTGATHTLALLEWSQRQIVVQVDRQIKMKQVWFMDLEVRRQDIRRLVKTDTGRLIFKNDDEFVSDLSVVNVFEDLENNDFYYNPSQRIIIQNGTCKMWSEWYQNRNIDNLKCQTVFERFGAKLCSTQYQAGFDSKTMKLFQCFSEGFEESTFQDILEECNLETLVYPNIHLFNQNFFSIMQTNQSALNQMIGNLSPLKFLTRTPAYYQDLFLLNPLLTLIQQRSSASLSTLVEFLPEYQNQFVITRVFDGFLSKLMELNINIEAILGSEAVWDTINQPDTYPIIGYNHKFSFTSPYNPMQIVEAQKKEQALSQSVTARSQFNSIQSLVETGKVKTAKVPCTKLVLHKSGEKKVTGQYKGTAFKEVLSFRFLFDVYSNDLKTLVEKDFMKEIIEHLLGTYQEQIDTEVRNFNLFFVALIVNIVYIHVEDEPCESLICTENLQYGRLNWWLIGLRGMLSLFVLSIMKDEFAQLMKKEKVWDYFTEVQNIWDCLVQVSFIAAVSLDLEYSCSDACLIMYAINFFCVFVMFSYQLKLYPSVAPFVVMITEGIVDVNFFVQAQIVFTCLFGCLFFIFGVEVEDSDGYEDLSGWGYFLMVFREGLGDFGNIGIHSQTDPLSLTLAYGESVCWLILALMVAVIFTNFMIAQVGWTFERVKSEEQVYYRFEVLSYIAQKIEFEDLMDMKLDPLIVFQGVDSSMAFKSEWGNDMPIIKGVVRNINSQINGLYKKMQRQFESGGKQTKMIKDEVGQVQTLLQDEVNTVSTQVKKQVNDSIKDIVEDRTEDKFGLYQAEVANIVQLGTKTLQQVGDTKSMTNNLHVQMQKVKTQQDELKDLLNELKSLSKK